MTSSAPITPSQYRIIAGFAAFLILSGAALALFGIFFLKSAQASRAWPSTSGEVQTIKAVLHTTRNNGRVKTYNYTVTYQYEVDDRTYTSDRYSLGSGSTASPQYDTARAARRAGEEVYPLGSEVQVYYDPANPASTVLKPGANFGTYVPLVMGLLFMPSGFLFFKVLFSASQPQG